jgi:DNA-binding response OmpR family regulator
MSTVLIVDDDEVVRGLLAWLFEEAGYKVVQAEDGRGALAMLSAEPPECMVLDLMMPEIDGLEVLRRRRLESLAPETRIVILTAKDSRADEVFCWEQGADEFMNKPFDGERLIKLAGDLVALSPDQLRHRREVGLAEAQRLDAMEQAFKPKP